MSTSDIATTISIMSGILLSLSESLPFLTNIKANGIVDFLINVLKQKFGVTNTNTNIVSNIVSNIGSDNIPVTLKTSDMNETLKEESRSLNDLIHTIDNVVLKIENLSNKIDGLTENITKYTDNNEIIISNQNTTSRLKLEQSESYELHFIINYIKSNYPKKLYITKFLSKNNKELLIGEGYIIDYDSEKDINVIKW